MKILIDMGHPAHVHQFKNAIQILKAKGHEVLVTARNKDVTLDLLNKLGIKHVKIGESKKNNVSKAVEMFRIDYKLYKIAKEFNPDILIGGSTNVYVTHISKFLRKKSIIFEDSEHAWLQRHLLEPFASAICTPSCYKKDLGKKQIRYNSYHELAYLHPNYFTPNPTVIDELGLSKDDTFIILRFVSWTSTNDVGQHGIKNKITLVRELEKYGQVFITSEWKLEKDLERYMIKVPPEKLHDLLYYAKMLIGDSQTMTTEAGVLGIPAVRCNSWVGENDMSNFIELEQKYALIFNFNDLNKALEKAVELIQQPNLKEEWKKKRETLLKDKIDVTAFMVWFIENYPETFKEMRGSTEIQYRFK